MSFIVVGQTASCVTSLFSVAYTLTAYQRALRISLNSKAKMTFCGMALHFFGQLFIIASRVLALAMFATVHRYWVFVVAGCHWMVMFVWILVQRTHFCHTKCQEFFFNLVMAIIYTFCYINLIEGHTRLRYIFYYSNISGN